MDCKPHQAHGLVRGVEVDLDRRQFLQPGAVGHFGNRAGVGLLHIAVPAHLVVGEEEELPALDLGPQGGVAFGDRGDIDPGGFLGQGKRLGRQG